MKTLPTIFFSLLIFMAGTAQTTRRVNNNAGISGTNVYATFALAQTAAANGDIIIIEPSTTSYGDITITKQLKIYGNGYFLNINTELKKDTRPSTLGAINFNTGSGGSEMYGITCGTIQIYGVSNLIISRNYLTTTMYFNTASLSGATNTNVSNIEISRNYIAGSITIGGFVSNSYTISNIQVTNNILSDVTATNDPIIQNWIVRNNTFYNGSAISLRNAIFENNLLMNSAITFNNVSYSYNVTTGANFPSETNGNKNNYDYVTNADFFGFVSYSNDEGWQLKAGSVPKTSSNNGGEVGAFGGSTPYIISGIPAIPSITGFINTGTGDASTPVKVTISVKGNN
jgi:hypothetical protein